MTVTIGFNTDWQALVVRRRACANGVSLRLKKVQMGQFRIIIPSRHMNVGSKCVCVCIYICANMCINIYIYIIYTHVMYIYI